MRLFVGNLPWSLESDDFRAIFTPYGEVKDVYLVHDRETGRPAGYGFVEFFDAAAGSKALSELDGKDVQGRALRVKEARPRPGGGGRR